MRYFYFIVFAGIIIFVLYTLGIDWRFGGILLAMIEAVKAGVENIKFIQRLVASAFRWVRVNIFKDKGVYEISMKKYFPSGRIIGRHSSEGTLFYVDIKDGLFVDRSDMQTYSSLSSLNSTFSKEKEEILEIWKMWDLNGNGGKLRDFDSFGNFDFWNDNSSKNWIPWKGNRSLQATCISWQRASEEIKVNVRFWSTTFVVSIRSLLFYYILFIIAFEQF